MSLSETIAAELKQEAATTRKMLERLPASEFDWKPHEKSMSLSRLATHVIEMTSWVGETVTSNEIDFSKMDYAAPVVASTEQLVEMFDKEVAKCYDALDGVADEHFMQPWTLRNGEQVYFTMPRIAVIRGMCLNHMVHHRGQLSVYMRLRDIAVPAIYGPSADETA
jgi:uncharacterized damage-inducible protein DinB